MGVSTTSHRRELVNARTAALDAQYTLPPAYGSLPAIDPMLMIWPVLRALKSVVISQPCCRGTVKVIRCAAGGRQTFDEELSEGNEAENIRRKHCVDVLILYIANDVGAVGAAGVVNCRGWFQEDEIKKCSRSD